MDLLALTKFDLTSNKAVRVRFRVPIKFALM
jgi:hypothetical protein